jgi:hypothetical protein
MLDNFRKAGVAKIGVRMLDADWLILKRIKASIERKSFGNKEVFALEKHCLLWQENLVRMKSDGKKDKWWEFDYKFIGILLKKTNSLILEMKAQSLLFDFSVLDDWKAYFDELELRYKSKTAEIDFEALQDFLKSEEAKEGLQKWRSLKQK